MEMQEVTAKSDEPVSGEWADGPRYLTRQPILDLRGKAHGYDVLLRNGLEGGYLLASQDAGDRKSVV